MSEIRKMCLLEHALLLYAHEQHGQKLFNQRRSYAEISNEVLLFFHMIENNAEKIQALNDEIVKLLDSTRV